MPLYLTLTSICAAKLSRPPASLTARLRGHQKLDHEHGPLEAVVVYEALELAAYVGMAKAVEALGELEVGNPVVVA
jgi:hypothetical protein